MIDNDKYKIHLLKATAAVTWSILIFLVITLVMYLWPRDIAQLYDYRTDQTEYHVGDDIYIYTTAEIAVTASTKYDVRLQCEVNRYLLASFDLNTTPRERGNVQTKIGVIPVIPTPDTCHIQTTAVYTVQIAPFLTRDYTKIFNTPDFRVLSNNKGGNNL